MTTLKEQITNTSPGIKQLINKRLDEFKSFNFKKEEDWFSELCFCILTANSRAKTAISIQNELGFHGFLTHTRKKISSTIRRNKHRFHNNKAKYIVEARKHMPIKSKIEPLVVQQGSVTAREWLVNNIKGLGYKEASHFLRNTGHEDIAILDRHILNLLTENKLIDSIPKPLSKSKYVEIENVFNKIAFLLDMTPAKLDLYMWYLKTGEVLK